MANQKWKQYNFNEIFNFDGSYSFPRESLGNEGVLYLHYGDMHTSNKNYLDVDNDFENIPKCNIEGELKFCLNDGDLVFVDASEDYPGTCKTFMIKNMSNKKIVAGLHTFIAREKQRVVCNDFKKYLTEIPSVKKQIYKYVQGYKVYGISRDNLKNVTVELTEYNESEKISNILDCWAKAIELQEKKIEKLELKKKALMQKLLRPNKDWESFSLGKACCINTGKLDVNQMDKEGRYPFFTCSKDIYKINKYAYDCEALLIAGNGIVGDIKYYKGKFNAYQRTYVLSDFKYNIKYIMYYLKQNFESSILKGMQKSSMPYIKVDLLKNAIIRYPENYLAIANIFDIIETKIHCETEILELFNRQQKVLMKKLLTGEIRVNGND